MQTIELPWNLAPDHLIDAVILQLCTPILFENGVCGKIDAELSSQRALLLDGILVWLEQKAVTERPVFILTPELSIPFECIDHLRRLASKLTRPSVVIGGLEYLSWENYEHLIQTSSIGTEAKETFLKGQNPGQMVNTSIILIGDGRKNVSQYVQPKTSPFKLEHSHIYHANEYLFFKTPDQASGKRLNFCVQICSDFTSDIKIEAYREALSEQDYPLDLTILLQCNQNQNADAFRLATKKYFEPLERAVITDMGSMILVNNANKKKGKSTDWGKSKIKVRHNNRWDVPIGNPQPTYYAKNYRSWDHQELVFRESGAGVYQFSYKPRYLVSNVSGDGDEVPLLGDVPTFSRIGGSDNFDKDAFAPIHPIKYWYQCEWEAKKDLIEKRISEEEGLALDQRHLNVEMWQYFLDVYIASIEDWLKYDGVGDFQFVKWTELFFINRANEERFPFNPGEPIEWCDTASDAIVKMLELYSLIRISQKTALSLSSESMAHAFLPSKTAIVFLFSKGGNGVRNVIMKYLSSLKLKGKRLLTVKKRLILVDEESAPDKVEILKACYGDISRAPSFGVSIMKPGAVTDPLPTDPVELIYGNELMGVLDVSENKTSLENDLIEMLSEGKSK